MVKNIRYQEARTAGRRRTEPRNHWVLEPVDAVLITAAVALFIGLRWSLFIS